MEGVQNNVKLLNEMLDSYKIETSSKDELDLINELHQSCERLKGSIEKVISEPNQTEEILGKSLYQSFFISYTGDFCCFR